MPSLISTSKAVGRFFTHINSGMKLSIYSGSNGELGNCISHRCYRSITGVESLLSVNKLIDGGYKGSQSSLPSIYNSSVIQRRGFLGCGDGDEGSNVLSKVYEEKRLMGYSPEQLYAVVAAVDQYQDFLPWCQRSDIVRRHPNGSFDAELEIGFKFLVESYVSHVEMIPGKSVKSTSSESNLFDHLINIWEFNPGSVPGSCNLHFFVDFKFQSPLYRQMASMFFTEVVSRLVGSFNDRCRLIYGPGVPILVNTLEQRR